GGVVRDDDRAIHLRVADGHPPAVPTDPGLEVGRRIEVLRRDAVGRTRLKAYLLEVQRECAQANCFADRPFQVLRGRRHYFDPGVAGVALLATDLDPLNVELDPQVHELVEDLREDHGVDDVSADLDDLGIPLFQRHDSSDATITPSNND